jgi:hypothetical protein
LICIKLFLPLNTSFYTIGFLTFSPSKAAKTLPSQSAHVLQERRRSDKTSMQLSLSAASTVRWPLAGDVR